MEQPHSTYQTDQQLEAILDYTTEWHLRCGNGSLIQTYMSLRDALVAHRNMRIAIGGDSLVAVTRDLPERTVIFSGQAERMVARLKAVGNSLV